MYEPFYGLQERPFDLTASPRFLFLTAKHREALSNLQYGISGQKGITLLVGEAGTGKTTLVRAALDLHRTQNVTSVYVNNPTLTRNEFYEMLSHGYGLGRHAVLSKTRFLGELERTLLERHRAGGISALLIDEAQSLPAELLEEIRLLSNLETRSAKLLPVVLIGQPELAGRLNEPSLRQLKQRLALRCTLEPLDLRETAGYITKRIRIAGGDSASMFTREAVERIYEHSRGIPRTINVICDNALLTGFALDRRMIDADIVMEVCRDFDLAGGDGHGTLPAPRATGPTFSPATVLRGRPDAPAEAAAPGRTAGETAPGDGRPSPAPSPPKELFTTVTKRRRFSFF
jgi:general secretion pathway protein A